MGGKMKLFATTAILAVAITSCHSHTARVADLQKQYDQMGAKYRADCSAEYLKVPPTLSPKCSNELKELDALSKRIQDERARN